MKITKTLIIGTAALLATSCSKSEFEYHHFYIYSPQTIIYADQYTDTLIVESTDSWEASTEADWISPKMFSYEVGPDLSLYQKKAITITPNTTGAIKPSYFTFDSNGRSYRRQCVQTSWLNIISPSPIFYGPDGDIDSPNEIIDYTGVNVRFEESKSSTAASGSIILDLYANSATVSTNAEWITLPQTTLTRTEGGMCQRFNIDYNLETNNTGVDRTGTITITSDNGVSTSVTITQHA